MKLADLHPKWIQPNNWCGEDFYIGISFDCPSCKPCPTCGRGEHRLALIFQPPVDTGNLTATYGAEWAAPFNNGRHHRTSGSSSADSLDTLTLSPSVIINGHWHGHIINGEVSNA